MSDVHGLPRRSRCASAHGWRNLRFFQDGDEWPALGVWLKRDGKVRHFRASQLGGTQDSGQNPRGAPDPTPLWNILDLTPHGRGTD